MNKKTIIAISVVISFLLLVGVVGFVARFYKADKETRQTTAELGIPEKHSISATSPAVDNSSVYIISSDKKLRSFEKKKGNLSWQVTAYKGKIEYPDESLIDAPEISDKSIYFTIKNTLYSFNKKNKAVKWTKSLGSDDVLYTNPIVYDGVVYQLFDDSLVALDENTGKEKWKFNSKQYDGGYRPLVTEKLVYINNTTSISAVDRLTGKEVWKVKPSRGEANCSLVLSKGKLIFCTLIGEHAGNLEIIDAEKGNFIARIKTKTEIITSDLEVRNSIAYFTGEKSFYALDTETKKYLWETKLGSMIQPVVVGNKVLLESSGTIRAFNAKTGKALWKKKITNIVTIKDQGETIFSEEEPEMIEKDMAFDDSQLYVGVSASSGELKTKFLYAIDIRTGKINWQR